MPVIWVVLVILWWALAGMRKQAERKKVERPAQPKTVPAQPVAQPAAQPRPAAMSRADEWEDEEDAWDERDAQRGQKQPVAPTVSAQPKTVQTAAAKKHASKPFEAHMHTPVMGVQGVGTEGIDCCHDFMLGDTPEDEPADFLPMQEEEPSDRAKALLQGVIYSEILGRRPVKKYQVRRSNS